MSHHEPSGQDEVYVAMLHTAGVSNLATEMEKIPLSCTLMPTSFSPWLDVDHVTTYFSSHLEELQMPSSTLRSLFTFHVAPVKLVWRIVLTSRVCHVAK